MSFPSRHPQDCHKLVDCLQRAENATTAFRGARGSPRRNQANRCHGVQVSHKIGYGLELGPPKASAALQSSGVVEASEAAMALNYSVFNWAVGFPATRALLGFLLFAQAELSEEMHRVQEMFKMSENPLIRLSAVVGLAESGGFFLELRLCLVRDVLKSNVKTRKPQLEVSGASGPATLMAWPRPPGLYRQKPSSFAGLAVGPLRGRARPGGIPWAWNLRRRLRSSLSRGHSKHAFRTCSSSSTEATHSCGRVPRGGLLCAGWHLA